MSHARPAVRVLIIHPRDLGAPTTGGIQTFLHDFVKHSPDDFEITVAGVTTDTRSRPIGRRRRVALNGRTAWMLPLARAGRLARSPLDVLRMALAQVRLRALMLDRRTILQLHRPFRPILLAGHRGPRVQFVHLDIRAWPGPSGWPRLAALYRPFSHRGLARMARVFVVNEPGALILRQDHPQMAERIEFLPVWFDERVFQPPAAGERESLRPSLATRHALPPFVGGERWLLFAGRLEQVKDPAAAVEAFAAVASSETRLRLLLAGDGGLRAALAERARELGVDGHVHFVGDLPREQLAELMRACDAFLLSSLAEGGGPRVVLEALASGLPVVTTDVGEVRRTVTSGVNGWIAAGDDPAAPAGGLVEGLRWVLAQPGERLAAAAVGAVQPYTAQRVLAPLYDTYRQLSADT